MIIKIFSTEKPLIKLNQIFTIFVLENYPVSKIMKAILLTALVSSAFLLTSCGTESCSCHTFSSIEKPAKAHQPASVSTEKPSSLNQ